MEHLRRSLPAVILLILFAIILVFVLVAAACTLTSPAATDTLPPTATLFPTVEVSPTPQPVSVLPTAAVTLAPTVPVVAQGVVTQPFTIVIQPNCAPRADWQSYIVQAGDTVGALAIATNTALQDLVIGNCLANPDLIQVGQTLVLPRAPNVTVLPIVVTVAPGVTAPTAGIVLVEPALVESGQYLIAPGLITARAQGVNNATSVRFYLAPTGTDAGPVLLGTDDNMSDGAVITFTIDRTPFVANVWAVASGSGIDVATNPILVANNG